MSVTGPSFVLESSLWPSNLILSVNHFSYCFLNPLIIWVCRCGTDRKQTGVGHTNLASHVKSEHAEDFIQMTNELASPVDGHTADQLIHFKFFFYRRKAVQVFGWIHISVNCFQTFSVVQNDVFRKHVRRKPISVNCIHKYLTFLTSVLS